MASETLHPQVPTNHGFACDKDIVNLVNIVNSYGWDTNNSCQDNNGSVWLCFDRYIGLLSFLNVIYKNEPELFHEIKWDISTCTDYESYGEFNEPDDIREMDSIFTFSVRFDPKHLEEIEYAISVIKRVDYSIKDYSNVTYRSAQRQQILKKIKLAETQDFLQLTSYDDFLEFYNLVDISALDMYHVRNSKFFVKKEDIFFDWNIKPSIDRNEELFMIFTLSERRITAIKLK